MGKLQVIDLIAQVRARFPIFRVAHKKPCRECPFRREHPPGWLGPDPVEAYLASIQHDFPISCHLTRNKRREPAQCAGSAIHLQNQMKRPHPADFAEVVRQFRPDVSVFQWTSEFEQHHRAGIAGLLKRRAKK